MQHLLSPDPPGAINCKARGYAVEIARLRAQGYTLESIRRALASVGVRVSVSTVWREANRYREEAAIPTLTPPSFTLESVPNHTFPPRLVDPPVVASPLAAAVPSREKSSDTADALRAIAPSIPPALSAGPGKELAEAFGRSQSANAFIRAKEQS